MPQTSAGLYRVILEQEYQNRVVFNVFGYLHSLGQDDEQDLAAQAFDEDIMPQIKTVQGFALDYTSIRAINITGSLADVVITPSEASGIVAGDAVTGFVAAPFRYNRETKDTRNGSKRLCGMVEQNLVTTGFEAAYFILLQSLATVFGTDISTVGGIFTPIILGEETITPGTWNYNTIVSVQALQRSTSQVSRKAF